METIGVPARALSAAVSFELVQFFAVTLSSNNDFLYCILVEENEEKKSKEEKKQKKMEKKKKKAEKKKRKMEKKQMKKDKKKGKGDNKPTIVAPKLFDAAIEDPEDGKI